MTETAEQPGTDGPSEPEPPRKGLPALLWIPLLSLILAGLVVYLGYGTIAA